MSKLMVSAWRTGILALCIVVGGVSCGSASNGTVRFSADPYWTELSKFMAGMAVDPQGPLAARAALPAYAAHREYMDNFWSMVDRNTLGPVKAWKVSALPESIANGEDVFYPLSGADFINMYTLYPGGTRYHMIAMENVGMAPKLDTLSGDQVTSFLAAVRSTIAVYGQSNYFQSRIMSREMNEERVKGVTPILMVFMARLGLGIHNVEPVGLDASGELQVLQNGVLKNGVRPVYEGVRIRFVRPDGKGGEVVYFSMKLTNESVQPSTPAGKYFSAIRDANTVMKSAVYIMHYDEYAGVRNFILSRSKVVVTDDSAIPYRFYSPADWTTDLYGVYKGYFPIGDCTVVKQNDLIEEFKNRAKPLPFNFGYGILIGPGNSNLMVAVRKKR